MNKDGTAGIQQVTEVPQRDSAEVVLTEQIAALWSAQRDRAAAARRTRDELKALHRDLGQRLHSMKSLLAQTGRAGRWASYLREQRIPRATADRLVHRHEQALTPIEEKRLTEAIPASIEQEIGVFFEKIRPQLLKVLTTQEAAFDFVCEMVCGLPGVMGDVSDEAAMIFRPREPGPGGAAAEGEEPLVHIEVG